VNPTYAETSRPWWALVVALLSGMLSVWLVVTAANPTTSASADDGHAAMVQVAPGGEVPLASLPVDHQAVYEAAAADEDAMTRVRCHCGCEGFLDHRHLLDCFVRPDGGWERHATGCAVCLAEAEEVLDMRDRGVGLDEIIERIDRRYGGITSPTV
jgi:DNA-binding helix-hairpin-helix protein with protein kinase domain